MNLRLLDPFSELCPKCIYGAQSASQIRSRWGGGSLPLTTNLLLAFGLKFHPSRVTPRQMAGYIRQVSTRKPFQRHLLFIKSFKLLTPDLKETWTLMGTHQSPVFILFHTTHKQVGNPESKEQVSSTVFLSTRVLPAIEVLENIGMPRLQIDCKRSRTLKIAQKNRILTELNNKFKI